MARYNNRVYKIKTEGSTHSKYYDFKSSKNIEKIMEQDVFQAIDLYEQYTEVYPKDYASYKNYLCLLIRVGNFEKTAEVLRNLEIKILDGQLKKVKDGKTKKSLIETIIYIKLQLLIHTEKYEEALEYIETNNNLIDINNFNKGGYIAYLKKQLGIPFELKEIEKKNSYLFRQLDSYSEQAFLEHSKRHIEGYTDEKIRALFYTDFPIEKIFEEAKKNYLFENRIISGVISDEYYFKYDRCGVKDGISCDYFVVRTFANIQEYLTMFPQDNINTYPYIDLNYLKEDIKPKIRKLSQIDKFNQRYGK